MGIRTTVFAAILSTLAYASCLSGQEVGHVETRTRLVSQFSSLQTEWLNAVKARDAAALDRLLGDDFEVWTPTQASPIPREEWQAQAFREKLRSFRVADMAVRSPRDGVAVESFRLETKTSRNGRDVTQQFFVVNLWVSDKDTWRCTDSYVSPMAAALPTAPGKPTGKG